MVGWAGLALIVASLEWAALVLPYLTGLSHLWDGTRGLWAMTSGFGLALLGLARFWLQGRRAGYPSTIGQAALIFSGGAYLIVVLTSALLIGPLPDGSAVFAGYALLGLSLLFQDVALRLTGILPLWATLVFLLSMIVQGLIAATKGRLPLWSMLPLVVAPLLSTGLLGLGGRPAGLLRGPTDVLYLGAASLLVGWVLLRAPFDGQQGPPSSQGLEPGT